MNMKLISEERGKRKVTQKVRLVESDAPNRLCVVWPSRSKRMADKLEDRNAARVSCVNTSQVSQIFMEEKQEQLSIL